MKKSDLDHIESLAKKMRISAVETGYGAGKNAAHFGGALSAIEILACLYGGGYWLILTQKIPTKNRVTLS